MQKSILLRTAIVIIIGLLFLGCATILSKSIYPVTINSTPDQATITVKDKTGTIIYQGTTPTTITLKSGAGFFSGARYTVSFEKQGFTSQLLTIDSQIDGWYIGNILFGGVIGLVIVDPATGAMWKLPTTVNATLIRSMTNIKIDGKEMHFALINEVPVELRAGLIRIK